MNGLPTIRVAPRPEGNVRLAERAFLGIEVQAGHTLFLIRAMASEAVIAEDGPDLAVEVYSRRSCAGGDS